MLGEVLFVRLSFHTVLISELLSAVEKIEDLMRQENCCC